MGSMGISRPRRPRSSGWSRQSRIAGEGLISNDPFLPSYKCTMRQFRLTFFILLTLASASFSADAPADFKSGYRVIDVHVHCVSASEGAIRAEIGVDDRVGVASVVVLDGNAPLGNLPTWIALKKKFSGRLIVFYKLSFKNVDKPTFFSDIVKEIDDAARQGIAGVKVWKDFGMLNRDGAGNMLKIDDTRLDPFWKKCAELKLPILWHTADEREYWFPLNYNSVHYGLRKEA